MIDKLQKMIDESKKIVVFTGAGVSTLSGIKDFRSKDGLYSMHYKYSPEYMLSYDCLINNTIDFFNFYRKYLNCLDYEDNIVHKYIKIIEDKNKLLCVITQNIDGLHMKAGSKKVYEIHGSVYRNYCMNCGKFFSKDYIFKSTNIPRCNCEGIVRPDVVLYGEMLPDAAVTNSIEAIIEADLLLVLGTSLTVYPASGLINYFKGKNLVIINRDTTPFDSKAALVINEDLGKVFEKLK